MGAKQHLEAIGKIHAAHFGTAEEQALVKRLAAEKARADADMAERFANLHMPDDIRQRAKSWGMESWATVLWNNAFQAGYREAMRDQKAGEQE
jgi:hypothetical protein